VRRDLSALRGNLRYASVLRLPLLLFDYQQVRQVEAQLVRRAGHVLFASVRDREALLGASVDRASVIPNGVDVDYWHRSSPQRGVDTIVFTGAMHYPPNADAALYSRGSCHSSVRSQRATNVGRNPTCPVRAGQQPGVP
jgi:hypothetical protein